MKNKITTYLSNIEREKGIHILYACETGSRAWGFPSRDSDYDVRLIYIHDLDWYLGLESKKDSMNMFLENRDIDISAWELKKTLKLLRKSNASIFERLLSPIVYKADDDFVSTFQLLMKDYFCPVKTIFHYLALARTSFERIDIESFKLKTLFYAMRATFAANWILTYNTIPPIDFTETMNGIELSNSLKYRILELIELKSNSVEKDLHSGEKDLLSYLETSLERLRIDAITLTPTKAKIDKLNTFFLDNLYK